jgi:hypothetical protein
MNIYVDIDGVLLANEENLADGAGEFIKFIAENHTVYWLTTHCMHGDATWAVKYVNRASDEDLSFWLEKFRPTTRSLKKTEAIDFTQPFIWYDDDLFSGEKADLLENNALNSWYEVNLQKHPNQLQKELHYLKTL